MLSQLGYEAEIQNWMLNAEMFNDLLHSAIVFYHQRLFSVSLCALKWTERATVWLITAQQIWYAEVDHRKEQSGFYVEQ